MPNGAIGALEAQQRIGAEIPYKNIAANPLSGFLNAVALGVEMNRKRQDMETKMARLAMENEKINLQRETAEARLGMGLERLQMQERNNLSMAGYRDASLALRQQLGLNKMNTLMDVTQDASGLEKDLNSIPKDILGTPEWEAKAVLARDGHEMALQDPRGQRIWNDYTQMHFKAAEERKKTQAQVQKNLEMSRKLAGITPYEASQPIDVWGYNPPDEKFPQGSMFLAHDAKTGAVVPWSETKKLPATDETTKKPNFLYKTVDVRDIDLIKDLRNQAVKSLYGTLGQIPADTPPPSKRELALRALNDPNASAAHKAGALKFLVGPQVQQGDQTAAPANSEVFPFSTY